MEMQNRKKVLGLSLVAAVLLGSSAYAGKIIGVDAGTPYVVTDPLKQYSFGGWNLDINNVNVKITDLDFVEGTNSFDQELGTYGTMILGDTFESELLVGGEIRALLHGKNWPVGEPAGIKIINGDTGTEHGKPENCIMTTSYLSAEDNSGVNGYLDALYDNNDSTTPVATICSSPFQSHKRFKYNMQPSMIQGAADGEYGQYVDLVFNLDPSDASTDNVRYQVFQKINNYTGKRLDGFKLEVLDENNQTNPALTLSLGIGEGIYENDPTRTDIWLEDSMANYAHGLWGPIDKHFPETGFFDSTRVYYPVTLSSDNYMISYVGDMHGGNYQDLFGNWLTNAWAPTGMFYDYDNDPTTDADIVAFFGTAPGFTEDAWYKRSVDPKTLVYTWSPATVEDFSLWSGDLYEAGPVEDTLNLGLNYIVNVGSKADIGATFKIRITPHIAPTEQQTPPSYVGKIPVFDINNTGTIAIYPNPIFTPGDTVTVAVGDTDLNNPIQIDEVNVTVVNDMGEEENITLTETGIDTAVFDGNLSTVVGDTSIINSQNNEMTVTEDTVVTAIYIDADDGIGGTDVEVNASTIAHTVALPVADAGEAQTVALNDSISITGTVTSVDPYAEIVSYKWKEGQTLLATTPTFTYVPTTEGIHTLTFIVTDNYDGVGKDDMNVTVTAPVNIPPTADAGPDKTVQVNETVTITGSGTDSDGTIVSYEWKYGTTVVATTASFDFTPTVVGIATLTLTVTDDDGLTGTDSMAVTVTAADATDPVIPPSSGGGGGCTYNPNSTSFDMTLLFMMALGALYPFRRRFIK